jgi:hypothetical protein
MPDDLAIRPASGGQESYRHGSRRVSQLKSISCTNISASMAFEQNRFYQPPHSVNQVAAKIISSANSLETRSHQTESSSGDERLLRFAQMQTDHDGVVGVAL